MTWLNDFDRRLGAIPIAPDLLRDEPTWAMVDCSNDQLIAAWLRIGELQAEIERLTIRQEEVPA